MNVRRWFDEQPVRRKLVLMAIAVTGLSLLVAVVVLIGVDLWRFHRAATDDVRSLARLVAQNVSAAVVFENAEDAEDILHSIRLRPSVRRACVYRPDGSLFAGVARESPYACPFVRPAGVDRFVLAASAPIVRNFETVGTTYVERDGPSLGERLTATLVIGTSVLVLATVLAFALAARLQRTISAPIVQLAAAARRVGTDTHDPFPPIAAAPDEVGELVGAFDGMLGRARRAHDELRRSNEALQREIDERRRMQAEREVALVREQEANRVKDQFLATVSHELRTPLNAIVGWSRILATGSPDAITIKRATESLYRNAQAQASVIDDLLDISRIVTGKLRVQFELVDLREPVDSAIDAVRAAAEQKGVVITTDMPTGAVLVLGDRSRLQQIVLNLLSNAVKFTPPGGSVSLSLTSHGGGCRVAVTDTGIGIAPEFLPQVFDRFRQADSSMAREHGGLGIGLAIVRELTTLHGGTISVSSDGRNRGSVFAVSLPTASERQQIGPAPVEAPLPSLAGVRVLAVDDNTDARQILETALTGVGARVRLAASGAEALDAWRHEPADVLLCDLAMPQMDGYAVLEGVRALDRASGRQTLAIAVTAEASEEQVSRTLRAGFHRHVAKPLDAADLVREVAKGLDGSSPGVRTGDDSDLTVRL